MADIQSATAEIRRGKKKKEDRTSNRAKNIMSASAMQGGHKKSFIKMLSSNPTLKTATLIFLVGLLNY